MTPGSLDEAWRRLVDDVDGAMPTDLRQAWDDVCAREELLVARQGIFSAAGKPFAFELSCPGLGGGLETLDEWPGTEPQPARVLQATFGRADLECLAQGRLLFVRVDRAHLMGEVELPSRPDRLVLEVGPDAEVDQHLLDALRRLRDAGYRIAIGDFTGRPQQRRLLPLADFVKIDARDLDVEGHPLVCAARAHGALVVADHVEDVASLMLSRDLGITLLQGDLLERVGIVDRSLARPVGR